SCMFRVVLGEKQNLQPDHAQAPVSHWLDADAAYHSHLATPWQESTPAGSTSTRARRNLRRCVATPLQDRGRRKACTCAGHGLASFKSYPSKNRDHCAMHLADPAALQIHWSLVPPDDAATLAPPGCLLLALWPAPVNHDACFEAAGFTFFADNGVAWNKAAEDLLRRVIEHLSDLGASELVS